MLTTQFCYILLHQVKVINYLHEGNILFDWFNNNSLCLNLNPGKTELVIYGTAQNLAFQTECNVESQGLKINHPIHYEYLGVSNNVSVKDKYLQKNQPASKITEESPQKLNSFSIRDNLSFHDRTDLIILRTHICWYLLLRK